MCVIKTHETYKCFQIQICKAIYIYPRKWGGMIRQMHMKMTFSLFRLFVF